MKKHIENLIKIEAEKRGEVLTREQLAIAISGVLYWFNSDVPVAIDTSFKVIEQMK